MDFVKFIVKVISTISSSLKFYSEEDINKLKAEKLYWVIMTAISLPIYVKDSTGRKQTYCNMSCMDTADDRTQVGWDCQVSVGNSEKIKYPMGKAITAYSYDLSNILSNEGILNTPIKTFFDNCLSAEKKKEVRILSQEDAQKKANKGILILAVSKKYGHMSMVMPSLKWSKDTGSLEYFDYNPEVGAYTGNAGLVNDVMFMSDKRGFGYYDWNNTENIIFVQFRLRITGKFED